jgi:hypothetical protein
MTQFARAALAAADLCRRDPSLSPRTAWERAMRAESSSPSVRDKHCPRGAFLGLCGAGLVAGIPAEAGFEPDTNGAYALAAVGELRREPALAADTVKLWWRVASVAHNSQMDVVTALWEAGLIADSSE